MQFIIDNLYNLSLIVLHGSGSPQMETITMIERYDLEKLKDISKYLFGIKSKLHKYERSQNAVTPRKMLEKFRKVREKKTLEPNTPQLLQIDKTTN